MIKVIAFDYGGVINLYNTDLVGDICNYLKIDRKKWVKEIFSVNYLFNTENKSFKEVMMSIVSKFDDKEETKNHIMKLLEKSEVERKLNSELIEVIKLLRYKSYKTALLSNASSELRQELEENKTIDLFDSVIISTEVGYQKPQPEIFEILFEKLNVKPNEVVFIDDTLKSLEGADNIGYIPILYKNNKTLKKELSNILKIELK